MIQPIKQMKNAVVVLFALFFCAGACPQKGKSPMTRSASAGTQEAPQAVKRQGGQRYIEGLG